MKKNISFRQKGAATLLISFFVLTVMMLVSFTAASIMIIEIRMSKDIAGSIPAFFAADAGAEKCWYQVRLSTGECNAVGGSFSQILDNGSITTATRVSASELKAEGNYNGTQRRVSLTW